MLAKTPKKTSQDDDLDRPIRGAIAIGEHIGLGPRQAYYLLETGKLDATLVGSRWFTTKRRLNRSLGIEA